jgi:hypothetical protein
MSEKNFDEWNKKCEIKKERIKEQGDFLFSLFIMLGLLILVAGSYLYYIHEYILYFLLVSLLVIFIIVIVFKSAHLRKRCNNSEFNN